MNDFKIAFRQLLKNRGFSAIAIVTLALGAGANAAIFSIVHGVLLKPLPYPNPGQLVTVWESSPERGIEQERVTGPDYLDWRAQNTVFSDMAVSPGWDTSDFKLLLPERVVTVPGKYTSSSYFTILGDTPLLGRTFLPEEDQRQGNAVAILSYSVWQQYFEGDTNILGRTLKVDNFGRRDYTIVGVMRPNFGAPLRGQVWLPLGWMGVSLTERRSGHWHTVIARLKPGVSLHQAQAQMNAIQARLKLAHPGETIGSRASVVPLVQQAVGKDFRTALFVLWGVVTGVLLIACANVANLMLARAASREKEIAVRLALGAGRWRVMRQLLIESVLLAFMGAGAGLLLSDWAVKLFILAGPRNIPRLAEIGLDGPVVLFTCGTALLTGIVFGLAPAWQTSKTDLAGALKDGSKGASQGISCHFTHSALVVAEVALAIVLLVGAGLMLQSFRKLLSAERGFHPERLVTAELDFSVSGFTTWVEQTRTRPQAYLGELLERVRHLPGVQSAGAAYRLVRPDNSPPNQFLAVFGRPVTPGTPRPTVEANAVTPDYLRSLGTPILRGRDFTEADTLTAPGVVLVNESFVHRFFPGEDPLGKFITLVTDPGPLDAKDRFGIPIWRQIVGVAGDVKSLGFPPEAVPEVYNSYWQWPMQTPTLIARVNGDPAALAQALVRETKSVIPLLPVPTIRSMEDRLSESVARPRFESQLLALFGGLALFLAGCGIYSVLAYAVAQRQREIGIRMAIGAQKFDILLLVLRRGLKLTLIGLVLGVGLSLALTQTIRNLLYGVAPTDPLTFALGSFVLLAVAISACWLPGRRAAKVDPMEALRAE